MTIDLYTWTTPNGRKVSILLEELGVPYKTHAIDISKNDQFAPSFVAINPNSKIPAIVDNDGPDGKPFSVFESGAILIYLAEKFGKFLPKDARGRSVTLQWLMFQMGGFGPMLGQAHHFMKFAPVKVEYGIERYGKEAKRLYGVLDKHLGGNTYLAGDEYTIADMATYPWAARHEYHQVDLAAFPNVKRWYDAIGARPAVKKGMAVP
ncbi:MAG: glutathione S-transferase N-terminal domain-containing protein [Alphaproteobacteria bacterium]|nr:glutathione S-transferase N-terminal domain-containing protein [Alphaproteobacteria bacterium]MCA0449784.1 glutathione S-transferase N-terminal domain-containing protein [Pseudomonadota bacterium]